REESERSEETVSAETLLSLNSLISPACDTPKLPDSALYGVIGDLVRRIEPHTEAHPAALVIQFLTGLGSIFGRSPYFLADSAKHHANLFAVVVGQSSRSRKGTSWNHIRRILANVDPEWAKSRVMGGVGSGEGIIFELKDEE